MIISPNMSNVMGSGVGAFAGSPAAAGRGERGSGRHGLTDSAEQRLRTRSQCRIDAG